MKSDVSRSITVPTVLGRWESAEVGGIVKNTLLWVFFYPIFAVHYPILPTVVAISTLL